MDMQSKMNEGGFVVNVYSPGNMFASSITFQAPVTFGTAADSVQQNGFTDEQIARAIETICGDNKPLCSKQLWAAVYWCLRWYCNFPVKGSDFCERVATLPFSRPLQPECDYNNIRRQITLSFMSQDARSLDQVKPSRSDEPFFAQCRVVVTALVQQLGEQSRPRVPSNLI